MRGAIVGFGTIAMGHLAAYAQMPDVKIVAIVDPEAARRAVAKSLVNVIAAYEDIEELGGVAPLDFIDVCTPPVFHGSYIAYALAMNCHVLCEKPMLLTCDEYFALAAAMKASDRVVYPCHNYKFSPVLRLVRKRANAESFGGIVSGCFRTLRAGHAVGVSEWRPNWRRERRFAGGGILTDHGTHSVYLASHLTGLRPVAVSCLTGRLGSQEYADTEDTALMTLRLEKSVSFQIDLSWAASFRHTAYSIVGCRESITVENDLYLHATSERSPAWEHLSSEFDDPSHRSWFHGMFRDFRDAVSRPERRAQLIREPFQTAVVIQSAYESASRGGETVAIRLPDLPSAH